jgi:translation initiation factor IF-1
MSEEKIVEVEGIISSVLPGTMFRVELTNGHQVLGHISGKLRKNFIKLAVGDRVKMEMNFYDLTKGRIIYRLKNVNPGPSFSRPGGSSHSRRR